MLESLFQAFSSVLIPILLVDCVVKSNSQLELTLLDYVPNLQFSLGSIVFLMDSPNTVLVTINKFNKYRFIFIQGIKFSKDENQHGISVKGFPTTLTINFVETGIKHLL